MTLAGLLNLDFRVPSIDYVQLLRCVRALTHSEKQVEQAYRQAVFNVIFNNKDDHSKNFSFMMDSNGRWTLTPAYDLTYNSGINGEHHMDIGGEAKHPTRAHLLNLATAADVDTRIIAQVSEVARMLPNIIAKQPIHDELAEQVVKNVLGNIQRVSHDS